MVSFWCCLFSSFDSVSQEQYEDVVYGVVARSKGMTSRNYKASRSQMFKEDETDVSTTADLLNPIGD